MLKLDQMEIFYFVATWQSFSKAARELNISKGYVSSQITALEKFLGVKLLQRTTRQLNLTEEGKIFYESCSKIVREKQFATTTLKEMQIEPSGYLKITAPPSMCTTFLADLLPTFQMQYPHIQLTIDSSSTVKNLLQHGIDIALRITHVPDEKYIARLITTFKFIICATPEYFNKHGKPKYPDDLLRHNCLIYTADPTQNRWPFQIKEKIEVTNVQGNLFTSSSSIIQKSLLKHCGIARLPNYVLNKEIESKKIEVIFSEYTKMEMPIYAIYEGNRNIPLRIKCFLNFLRGVLGKK